MCYVCNNIIGSCDDEYAGDSSHETDCSGFGYTDDGSCSKAKVTTTVLGNDITLGNKTDMS